jgi:hypothetical protein
MRYFMRGNTQANTNAASSNKADAGTSTSSKRSRTANSLGGGNSASTDSSASSFAFSSSESSGNSRGAFDTLMKPFTASKYSQERHARSLDPMHLFQGYSFVGPGTELHLRNQLEDATPLNSLDRAAKAHDNAYGKEAQEYSVDRNKNKHMQNIWSADSSFIASTFLNRDDPIMGTIGAGLIGMKMLGEKAGLLDTKRFSGIQDTQQSQQQSALAGTGSSTLGSKGGAALRDKEVWDKY